MHLHFDTKPSQFITFQQSFVRHAYSSPDEYIFFLHEMFFHCLNGIINFSVNCRGYTKMADLIVFTQVYTYIWFISLCYAHECFVL